MVSIILLQDYRTTDFFLAWEGLLTILVGNPFQGSIIVFVSAKSGVDHCGAHTRGSSKGLGWWRCPWGANGDNNAVWGLHLFHRWLGLLHVVQWFWQGRRRRASRVQLSLQELCDIVDDYMAEDEQKLKLQKLGEMIHPKSWLQRAVQCNIDKIV